MSLSTTWRHKYRELRVLYYLALDGLQWPFRLLVNWLIFFTLWAWIGFVYMILVAQRAYFEKRSGERAALTGKIWWHQQYKLY